MIRKVNNHVVSVGVHAGSTTIPKSLLFLSKCYSKVDLPKFLMMMIVNQFHTLAKFLPYRISNQRRLPSKN
jgi:hypothetical protein